MQTRDTRERRKIMLSTVQKQPKQKAWNHQQDLADLIGKEIVVQTVSREFRGELLNADQFTLKMKVKAAGRLSVVTVFKSSMTYFSNDVIAPSKGGDFE